jgi:hypothetical protein
LAEGLKRQEGESIIPNGKQGGINEHRPIEFELRSMEQKKKAKERKTKQDRRTESRAHEGR